MMKHTQWAVTICLLLLPATVGGHELNFDGKLFTGQELMHSCIGNLNGLEADGTEIVDVQDVILLVAQFGIPCPGECEFDLNHNKSVVGDALAVGEGDLRVLLGNWGPCRNRADIDGDGDMDHDDAAVVVHDLGFDCHPDLDFSGRVGGNDFNLAELAWGPGTDHQGDVDRDGFLEITDDLLAVFYAQGRRCTGDVDLNGTVECKDLEHVCAIAEIDCCDIGAVVCPDLQC